MMIDSGKYNLNQKLFSTLINELNAKYPEGIKLNSEYAYYVQEDMLRLLIQLARYKFVFRLIKKRDCVLDVGCGSGLGSIFLAQNCAHVTGIDVKTSEIETAKSINLRKNMDFKKMDLFDLPIHNKFDVIIAIDVIEHMSKHKGKALISKMSGHLKKDGMVIIGTPSIYSLKYQGKLSRASHVKCYDQVELAKLTENYFGRTVVFSMNDEIVHTGNPLMSWYYFIVAFYTKIAAVNKY